MDWLLNKLSPIKLIEFFSTKLGEWGLPGIGDFLKSLLGSGLIPDSITPQENSTQEPEDVAGAPTSEQTLKEMILENVNDAEGAVIESLSNVFNAVGLSQAGLELQDDINNFIIKINRGEINFTQDELSDLSAKEENKSNLEKLNINDIIKEARAITGDDKNKAAKAHNLGRKIVELSTPSSTSS